MDAASLAQRPSGAVSMNLRSSSLSSGRLSPKKKPVVSGSALSLTALVYAYKTRSNIPPVDFKHPDDAIEFAYCGANTRTCTAGWRRSTPAKQGSQQFNCVPVRLDAADLDALASSL